MLLKMLRKKESFVYLVLISIFLFAIIMRFYKLGYGSIWIDEGFTLMQARGIALHGYPLLDSGYIEWKDILIPYIIAPAVKLFGFKYIWLLRLPSAIFSVATIFIWYYFVKKLFSWKTAMVATLFLSTCYWHIAWGQQIRGYSALIFFIVLFFYFLAKHVSDGDNKNIFLAMASMFLAILSKQFGLILVPVLLFYLILQKKITYIIYFFIPLLFVVILVSWSEMITLFDIGNVGYLQFYLLKYLWAYFGIFNIFFCLGVYYSLITGKKYLKIHLSIMFMMIFSIIFVSFFVFVSERRYLLFITQFLFMYAAFAITYLAELSSKHRYSIAIILTVTILIYANIEQFSIVFMPEKQYNLEDYTPQPNYNKAYQKIIREGFSTEDTIISTTPYLDIIYLGRADYVIPWSLTGLDKNKNINNGKEYYSGAKIIGGLTKKDKYNILRKLQQKGRVYVVFDSLSQRRMDFDFWDDITENGRLLVKDGSKYKVSVYVFDKL